MTALERVRIDHEPVLYAGLQHPLICLVYLVHRNYLYITGDCSYPAAHLRVSAAGFDKAPHACESSHFKTLTWLPTAFTRPTIS